MPNIYICDESSVYATGKRYFSEKVLPYAGSLEKIVYSTSTPDIIRLTTPCSRNVEFCRRIAALRKKYGYKPVIFYMDGESGTCFLAAKLADFVFSRHPTKNNNFFKVHSMETLYFHEFTS